ncbi:RAVE subunit 2/Rogdi [Daldinia sp. FL1419]|nr:RAVE subunit 2/Rogdi [Daldinia sp. FL1419]
MSVEIWPPISPAELKVQEDATQARELTWLLSSLRATLAQIKGGLEDCCALLNPADSAGSTLALTTPRNETVKGHTTRVGVRLVRGLVHLRLRTLPPQTLSLDPSRPVRVPALIRLDDLLSRSLELCHTLEDHQSQKVPPPSAPYLASQLRLLALQIAEAAAIVKGPPHPPARPSTSASTASHESSRQQHQPEHKAPLDTAWTTNSVSLGHFTPPLSRNLSLYVTIQDACLVIYLRALEPADAPVNFGTKLALAIGTTRRLEHDEADRVFSYRCDDESQIDGTSSTSEHHSGRGGNNEGSNSNKKEVEVYVREKVRVESADPSLLSLSVKLSALGNTLGLARRNLAAVMGEDLED